VSFNQFLEHFACVLKLGEGVCGGQGCGTTEV